MIKPVAYLIDDKEVFGIHDLFSTLLERYIKEGRAKPLYAIPEGYALVPIEPTFEEIEKINLAASEHGIFRPQHGDVNSMLKLMGIAFGEAGGVK